MKIISSIVLAVVYVLLFITLLTSRSAVVAGIRSFVVLSGSMEPTLPVGSLLYIRPTGDYQKGEIITFERAGQIVTHRIMAVMEKSGETFFRTKGDANSSMDGQLVEKSIVIGKKWLILPNLGKVVMFAKTMPGFLCLIFLPGLIFIILQVINLWEEFKKNDHKGS